MTAEEFEHARRLMTAIAKSRPQRPLSTPLPGPRGDRLDLRRLLRRSLRTGGDPSSRRCGRASASRAGRPLRRLRLDGSIHASAPGLPARPRRQWAGCGGVRVRHPADQPDRDLATRDPDAAIARATATALDWGSGTRIGERARGIQRHLRAACPLAWRRRRCSLGRLGTRRPVARRPRDGEARARSLCSRLGQPAEGEPGVPAARRRHARGAAVRRPVPAGAQPPEPGGAGDGTERGSSGGTRRDRARPLERVHHAARARRSTSARCRAGRSA